MRARPYKKGPFRAEQVREGDEYELVDGHAYASPPAGGRHGGANATGALPLSTDPAVESAGVDTGFSPEPDDLHAPDIAIGNVEAEPGWVRGKVPALAVEYADKGEDEEALQAKIASLLEHGTRFVWVARLTGPRRVEIHAPGQPVRVAAAGERLEAPGVLQNPVAVDALFDRDASFDQALVNLLQRKGYGSVEAIREEGREEGQSEAIVLLLEGRGITLADDERKRILACRDREVFRRWLLRAATAPTAADVIREP